MCVCVCVHVYLCVCMCVYVCVCVCMRVSPHAKESVCITCCEYVFKSHVLNERKRVKDASHECVLSVCVLFV